MDQLNFEHKLVSIDLFAFGLQIGVQ